MKTINYQGRRWLERPNSSDSFVMGEADYDGVSFSESDVWLDLGANIGALPIKFADCVQAMICFEPEPVNFQMLSANVRMNDIRNVILMPFAISHNFEPKATLFVNKGENKGKHSVLPGLTEIRPTHQIEVNCMHICDAINMFGITCIKMDVEGYEMRLLDTLLRSPELEAINTIVLEAHLDEALFPSNNSAWSSIVQLFIEQGFSFEIHAEDKAYNTKVVEFYRA